MQYFLYIGVMLVLSICFCFLTKKEIICSEKLVNSQICNNGKIINTSSSNLSIKFINRSPLARLMAIYIIVFVIFIYFVTRYVGVIDGVKVGGIDALVYKARFLNATGNIFESLKSQGNEYGYGLLVYLVRLFTSNFNVFLAVYYAIMIALICNFLKRMKSTPFLFACIVIFVTMPLFSSMNLMRNILAYFLLANASIYLLEKKYKLSTLFVVLAVSCHISALVFVLTAFIYYVLKYKKIRFGTCLILQGLMIALGYFGLTVLEIVLKNTKYGSYFTIGASSINSLLFSFIIIFFVCWRYKQNLSSDTGILGLAFMLVNIFVAFMQFKVAVIYRLFIFYGIGIMFLQERFETVYRKKYTTIEYFCIIIIFAGSLLINLISHITSTIPSYGLLPWYSIFGGL